MYVIIKASSESLVQSCDFSNINISPWDFHKSYFYFKLSSKLAIMWNHGNKVENDYENIKKKKIHEDWYQRKEVRKIHKVCTFFPKHAKSTSKKEVK